MKRKDRLAALFVTLIATGTPLCTRQANAQAELSAWQSRVKQELPLLGHRNWILIVDSAYPLQTSPGVETIDTGASMSDVRTEILRDLQTQKHLRPITYMDAELPYLREEDAPGVESYRQQTNEALRGQAILSMPHEAIIARINETGKLFHVLVLKTNLTIPYTSLFLQLDCKYWSSAAEAKLRSAMKNNENPEEGKARTSPQSSK